MIENAQFKVGDLILLPHVNTCAFDYDDYGIVFKVEAAGKKDEDDIHYHIYWAIDQTDTIEGDVWVNENMELIARA